MYPDPTRVAVVCDCPLYLRGIADLVTSAADLRLVAAVRGLGELSARLHTAEIVLLDLPRESAGEISRLQRLGLAVIVIRGPETQSDIIQAIQAGAGGYLSQQAEEAELLAAIRAVAHGHSYICARLSLRRLADESVHITGRERQILQLLAEGCTDREIAAQLKIGECTVHSHLDRLRDKSGSRRRADLTRFAIAHGIVT